MPLNCIIKFNNLVCEFSDFFPHNSFDTWWWKLDPYKIFSGINAQVLIKNSTHEGNFICPIHSKLLWSEFSGFFRNELHEVSHDNMLWSYIRNRDNMIFLQYVVNFDWSRIILLKDNTNTAGHLAFEYLGQIIPYVLLNHQTLTFHGVLMEHHGKGIIISAPSGTGKTTHARMWRDSRNALIINGDRATCQKVDGVWTGFGLPWSGTSGEQINRSVPITAIVVLERGDINQTQLLSSPLEAFISLLPHVQYPSWDKKLANTAMDLLEDFLQEIPVIRLCCLPDLEAVDILEKAIEQL